MSSFINWALAALLSVVVVEVNLGPQLNELSTNVEGSSVSYFLYIFSSLSFQ